MQDTISASPHLAYLTGSNPVLSRELRSCLRNERAFALLALYVALLGAVVASQFPADQTVANVVRPGSGAGYDLFLTFCIAQACFIVLLLPALASGALAQERERGTLEPILLTPLTPEQIVWGKAVGVLCFGFLLLLATLPLTSLSFLLGGVSPADIITAYAVLLGLSAFVTGFGLYCSARWPNAIQATLACYGLLPIALGFLLVFSGPGSIVAGISLVGALLFWIWKQRLRWKGSRLGRAIGVGYDTLAVLVVAAVFIAFLMFIVGTYGLGLRIFCIVCLTPYLLFVSRLGLERTGEELSKRREPRRPTPERLSDLHEDWKRAVAPTPVVYVTNAPPALPHNIDGDWASLYDETPTQKVASPGSGSAMRAAAGLADSASLNSAPEAQPAATFAAQTAEKERQKNERASKPTYGVRPFLSDKINPILAKDMRSGLLGKWSYLARFAYIFTIGSELLLAALLGYAAIDGNSVSWIIQSPTSNASELSGWACLHLAMLMFCGALFGARALAPEREQQTLQQLLTTPLSHATIITGKLMSAGLYTLYVFLMGAPFALLLGMLGIVPLQSLLSFLAIELVLGAFAATWGVFCSMRGGTVRRALGWSLGGLTILFVANIIRADLSQTAGPSHNAHHMLLIHSASKLTLPFMVMSDAVSGSPLPDPYINVVFQRPDIHANVSQTVAVPLAHNWSLPGQASQLQPLPPPPPGLAQLYSLFTGGPVRAAIKLLLSLIFYLLVTALLAFKTAADFRRYASTV
jgi:ABC-type transport system involved in multi-copper enzyme maturation permease subunit